MRTCKSCEFWDDQSEYYTKKTHKLCTHKKLNSSLCGTEDDGLSDNADYDYGLTTGPNFGCIHYKFSKVKEENDGDKI